MTLFAVSEFVIVIVFHCTGERERIKKIMRMKDLKEDKPMILNTGPPTF